MPAISRPEEVRLRVRNGHNGSYRLARRLGLEFIQSLAGAIYILVLAENQPRPASPNIINPIHGFPAVIVGVVDIAVKPRLDAQGLRDDGIVIALRRKLLAYPWSPEIQQP